MEGGVLAGSGMGSGTVVIVGLVDCLDGWRAIFGLAWCFGLWSIGGGDCCFVGSWRFLTVFCDFEALPIPEFNFLFALPGSSSVSRFDLDSNTKEQ